MTPAAPPPLSRDTAAVGLEFVDLRRDVVGNISWLPPFDWSVAYENEHWWDEARYYYVNEPWFVSTARPRAGLVFRLPT
jgi:hypothetical protein